LQFLPVHIFYIGIFITYLLLGLGMLTFLKKLLFLKYLWFFIYYSIAVLVFLAGAASIYDYFQLKRGQASKVLLQLPASFKKLIHSLIRVKRDAPLLIFSAFGLGILVALIESVCTGQVYLPVILMMIKLKVQTWKAFSWLMFYNFFFVLPTIVVFVLVLGGISSEKLQSFFNKHVAVSKLLMSLAFFLLFFLLIFFKYN